jgi:phosphate transport system permease protein
VTERDVGRARTLSPPGDAAPRGHNLADNRFRRLTAVASLLIVILLASMAFEMALGALPALKANGLAFLTSSIWDPARGVFGALPFVWGTVVSSLLALSMALPISLGVAIYLSEFAPPWLRETLGIAVELLAAVPSVVYGLWGIFVLLPWLRDSIQPALGRTGIPLFSGPAVGHGMLAGGIVLAIMVTPTICSVSREVLRAVPSSQREAATALGATRWEVVNMAVLPYARSGLFGAAILGLGRALGETMAITMVIGNRPEISTSLFAPSYTMASVLANEFAEASAERHLSALSAIALLLFAVTVALNVLARLLSERVGRSFTARGPA